MTEALRRVLRFLRWPLWTVVIALSWMATASAADIPYLTGRVVDDANIIDAETRTRLTEKLKAHEDATGNQVVVLTVPTIQPDSVEDYAVKVFESWKLGQKGKDNGVLVVVVPNDRKMRIEVGYGLEGTLPDGACGQIIRSQMTPQFKAANYSKGIEDGVDAIVTKLNGGELPPDVKPESHGSVQFERPDISWPMRILLGAFIFGIIGLFTVIGVMTPGMGWFLYFFLIPFWAMFPIAIIGPQPTLGLLATYIVCYPIAKIFLSRSDWYKKAAKDLKTKGSASIGGFTFGSAGGSGGFSSGGGFSGGGGSSGGGGASGSW